MKRQNVQVMNLLFTFSVKHSVYKKGEDTGVGKMEDLRKKEKVYHTPRPSLKSCLIPS